MTQYFITDENKQNTFLPEMNNCHLKPQSHVDISAFICQRSLCQITVSIYLEKKMDPLPFPKHHLCRVAI